MAKLQKTIYKMLQDFEVYQYHEDENHENHNEKIVTVCLERFTSSPYIGGKLVYSIVIPKDFVIIESEEELKKAGYSELGKRLNNLVAVLLRKTKESVLIHGKQTTSKGKL